jgi:hypothetical protein
VRRNLGKAIELARQCQLEDSPTLHEAYRLLGTGKYRRHCLLIESDLSGLGLHTLEDLLAHSNWVELTLLKMGYSDVFPYVGERVILNTPCGPAPPLVTGT